MPYPPYNWMPPMNGDYPPPQNAVASTLSGLLRNSQAEGEMQRMTEMAAARIEGLGPQGAQWAQQIRKDPRAALQLADAYGGFGEIEGRLAGARAQGELGDAIGEMQQGGASAQDIVNFMLRTQGPAEAEKTAKALGLGQSVSPKAVLGEDGQAVYVSPQDAIGKRPVPRAPLVQIGTGESGMKPEQAVAAEDRAASQVDSRVKPLQDSLDAYDALNDVVSRIRSEGREPNQNETDTIVKLASRLENPEAVQEGDIARKAGGTLMNAARAKLGMGVVLDPGRLDTIMSVADTIANGKRNRLKAVQAEAQAVARERGLNPNAVSPNSRIGSKSATTPIGTRRVMQDPDSGQWIEYEKVDGGWDPVD